MGRNNKVRLFFFILFTILANGVSSQIVYNSKIEIAYKRAFKRLPKINPFTQDLLKDDGYRGGIVVTTFFAQDTLNKTDLISEQTTVKVSNSDGGATHTEEEFTVKDMPIQLILGEVKSDTLNLKILSWFMANESIHHQIIGNSVTTTYNEHYKDDSLLVAKNSKTKTSDLTIPVKTISFILSDKNYAYGKTIFGYAEIETDDFYFLNAFNFKNHKIHKKIRQKYYFKIELKKPLE